MIIWNESRFEEEKVRCLSFRCTCRRGEWLIRKRKPVATVTNAMVKSLDVKPEDVRIILEDTARHDYAVAGTLIVDRKV